jgi:hypothetical protein
VGLVESLIWNRRTGNLVGGHQRISILDELEGSQDYSLDVSVIDVPPAKEKALNVALNNTSMQGQYELDSLAKILEDVDVDRRDLGFDDLDLQLMFDDPKFGGLFADAEEKDVEGKKMSGKLEEMRAARHKYKAEKRAEDDPEFYIVVVFDSRADCDLFQARAGLSTDMRYHDGRKLAAIMGVDLTPEPVARGQDQPRTSPVSPEPLQAQSA